MSRIIRTDPGPIHARAVEYHGFVYTQGLTAHNTAQGAAGQIGDVLAQIDALLETHGTDNSRLLQVQIWLKHMADLPAFLELWKAWLPQGQPPAIAVVQADLSDPSMLVEIMVTSCK